MQSGVAVLRSLPLQGIARHLHIVADALGVFLCKQVPLRALAQRLQPFGAKPVGKRHAIRARQKRAHSLRASVVETKAKLPVRDIDFEQMTLKPRRDSIETRGVAGLERVARGDKIGIARLRMRGQSDGNGKCREYAAERRDEKVRQRHRSYYRLL